jgi:threonylcarbamoyladenosine tRNA methylthiotransferase MtaB
MPTFAIQNFGCRATHADAAVIERQLRERGYALALSPGDADVLVLNTCTVTAAADAQARDAIRGFHRKNPAARIIATGCYAQRAPEELAALEGVSWVVGNAQQPEIPRLADETLECRAALAASTPDFVPLAQLDGDPLSLWHGPAKALSAKILTGDISALTEMRVAPLLGGEGDRTRPTLKIQDGCNRRCSYCVIPSVRGASRSLPPEQVLGEVRRLAGSGFREVVLSGINLGSYGRDLKPRAELLPLLQCILEQTPLQRLRLSSIEPMDVTQELIELVACAGHAQVDGSPQDRVAHHFHVPLQSGADRILRAMHRRYRAEHYARRIELVREMLPDAAIGADVMAGFPGETEEDHRATLDFIARLPFTYLHVFSFSTRPGTAAAVLEGSVSPPIIKRRARELRVFAAEKAAAFRAAQEGRTRRVLTLHRRGENWTAAISGNYLTVRVAGHWPANQWMSVTLGSGDEPVTGDPLPGLIMMGAPQHALQTAAGLQSSQQSICGVEAGASA